MEITEDMEAFLSELPEPKRTFLRRVCERFTEAQIAEALAKLKAQNRRAEEED